jgi:hypothetical protein
MHVQPDAQPVETHCCCNGRATYALDRSRTHDPITYKLQTPLRLRVSSEAHDTGELRGTSDALHVRRLRDEALHQRLSRRKHRFALEADDPAAQET